jgi:TonB family protein
MHPPLLVLGAIVPAALACAAANPRLATPPHPTSCSGQIGTDSTIYELSQVTEKPDRRGGPPPEYPLSAMEQKVEGTVILTAVIEPTGEVDSSSVRMVQGADQRLNESAVHTLKRTQFWPACCGREAVRVRVTFPVSFSMARH